MRGSIVKRSKTSWALVVDQGRDPTTGKRKQKWVKFDVPRGVGQREAHKQAEAKLAELLHQIDKGTYVDATKTTLVEYLRAWHEKNVVPHRRPETARIYLQMINGHIAKASIARLPLQKVRTSDLEGFYATLKLSASSVTVCHAVIGRALKIAVRDKLIVANPAVTVEDRPRVSKDHGQAARLHCWSADEAGSVLTAAKEAGPQVSAFFTVLLDTGVRKSEALGLTWSDVDLDAGTLTISRQLEPRRGERPEWGPTKTGTSRTVTLGTETTTRLLLHRKHQRELMMANRTTYKDHGLVFAKEPEDLQRQTSALGQPCPALVGRHFRQVVKAAGVRAIKVHGTRHTVATLLLQAGVPVQVVAQRLGHAQITQTLDVYAHALPDMQRDAAVKLGALLAGGRT
jgi:integrase